MGFEYASIFKTDIKNDWEVNFRKLPSHADYHCVIASFDMASISEYSLWPSIRGTLLLDW